jgi:hypothetical protein
MVGKPMISQRPWGLFNVPKNLFWTRVILHNVYPALSLFIMKEQECAGRRR